ncbi:MAG: HD domain-containing protein [Rickettsiaceae bacterium]|nr:HD domain-containing protein [Rickettsiaceae bacterium]MDD9337403.1 HD domain-containing protein [Rickettsiaceae bacterium]
MKDINNWQSKFAPCEYYYRLMEKLHQMNQGVNMPIDLDEVKKAVYYAKKYHGSQMRQSGEPYYTHPIEVAYIVSDYLPRTDIIVTSLLHDTIEDTELTEPMIAHIFGNKVASQVEALSRNKPYGKISSAEMVKILYRQKKYDVLMIKIIDRLHNTRTIGAKSPEKIKKIIEETFKKFLILAIALDMYEVGEELSELCYNHLACTPFLEKDCRMFSEDNFKLKVITFENDLDPAYTL